MIVNAGFAMSAPHVEACVSVFVTRIPYPPSAKPAGTVAVIVVELRVCTVNALRFTTGSGPMSAAVAPGRKFSPVITTSVAIGRYAQCVP